MNFQCIHCNGVVKHLATACPHCKASLTWTFNCVKCGGNYETKLWITGQDPVYKVEVKCCPKCHFPLDSYQMQCIACLENTFVLLNSCHRCGRALPMPSNFGGLASVRIENYRKGATPQKKK